MTYIAGVHLNLRNNKRARVCGVQIYAISAHRYFLFKAWEYLYPFFFFLFFFVFFFFPPNISNLFRAYPFLNSCSLTKG